MVMRIENFFVHVFAITDLLVFFSFLFHKPAKTRAESGKEGGKGGRILVPCKTVRHVTHNTNTVQPTTLKRAAYLCAPSIISETFVEDAGFRYSSASVNNFIVNELQLDDASRDAVSEVVDRLYKHQPT